MVRNICYQVRGTEIEEGRVGGLCNPASFNKEIIISMIKNLQGMTMNQILIRMKEI